MHAGEWGGRSLWYRWKAPADGRVALAVQQGLTPLLLGVYEGDAVESLREIARARGVNAGGLIGADFEAVAGREYAVAVDGLYGGTGNFEFSLQQDVAAVPQAILAFDGANRRLRLSVSGLSPGEWLIESGALSGPWMPDEQFHSDGQGIERTVDAEEAVRVFRVRKLSPR